jgi:LacI family transcriptional regulator
MTLEGVRRAEKELGPFGLNLEIVHFDRYDNTGLLEAGRRILEEEFDGVLMAPLNEMESRLFLDRLNPDVPLVFFDTDLPGTSRLAFIGQDSLAGGRIAGRLMNLLTAEKSGSRVLILTPDTNNEHLHNRIQGFQESILREARLVRITIESDHDSASLYRILEKELASGSSGIFVTDASAHYAAEYVSRYTNMKMADHDFAIIGYDLVPENRRWLEEGLIDFLLTQRPDEQGYDGVSLLFRKIVLGEDPPEHVFTPIDIVTRENVIYFPGQQTKETSL